MQQERQSMSLLTSIVDRGQGNTLTDYYTSQSLICHTHCVGAGTASSKMLDVLGIDNPEKDIIYSIGSTKLIRDIMQYISNNKSAGKIRNGGILFSVRLTALNGMVATVLNSAVKKEEYSGVKYMDQKTSNSLIMVTVNQGYTDEMMQVARKAGATGGTIVRSRWSDGGQLEKFHGISIQEEREIVFILASEGSKRAIMDAINKDFGLMSEAHGLISCMPVEYTTKL